MKLIKILQISLGTLGFLVAVISQFYSSVLAVNIEDETNDNNIKNTLLASPASNLINRVERETIHTGKILELSLEEAVNLASVNNRSLKNAYLDRIIERESLAEAKAIYIPRLTPTAELNLSKDRVLSGISITDSGIIRLGSDLSFLIPSGGEFSISWNGGRQLQTIESLGTFSDQDSLNQTLSISFNQPLLRGFGSSITNIPIVFAELNEDINILDLKNQLINIITQTIVAYRSLVQAQSALKIEQEALDRALEQLEITRAFIEAGRRARVDIIQNQTQIANQELALIAAENRVKDARASLIQILDIDRSFEIIATETPESETIFLAEPLNPKELLKLAFANDPGYLTALINIDLARLDLLLAKDDIRWDLDLNLKYENNLDGLNSEIGNSNVSASLNLRNQFFGRRTPERNIIRSQVRLEQSLIDLEEAKENLTIEVKNDIRQVNFALQQARQARRARELALEQLEIEREKQRLGVGSLFQLISFENSLVQAQNQELNAIIAYLNSLTDLRKTLGITLDFWEVKLEK